MNREKSINVLGFDPYEQKYGALPGLQTITPEIAKYILDNHNKDNRAFSKGQQSKISKSIEQNGMQCDGDALRFNKEGNIPEFQHRLVEIHKKQLTVEVPVVLGVEPESFTKTAGALPRGPYSEISRIDPDAIKEEATVLGVVILFTGYGGRKSKNVVKKLTLQNASTLWPLWKDDVRNGISLCQPFFNRVSKINKDTRVINAWATMMIKHGYAQQTKKFLTLLGDEILGDGSSVLARDFISLYEDKEVSYLSNMHRPHYVWKLLCIASDKIIKREDGAIEMDACFAHVNSHDRMKQRGIYRKFLVDPGIV